MVVCVRERYDVCGGISTTILNKEMCNSVTHVQEVEVRATAATSVCIITSHITSPLVYLTNTTL